MTAGRPRCAGTLRNRTEQYMVAREGSTTNHRSIMSRLEALLQLLALDHLPRTGWSLAGVPAPDKGNFRGSVERIVRL